MKISLKSKISVGLTLSTSVALIIIGAMLVKYKVDPAGSLFYLVGIVIAIVAFINLLNYVSGKQKQVTVVDYLLSVGLLVVGILVATFSETVQAYGMLLIGIMLVGISILDFISSVRKRSVKTIIEGVLRLVIGVAFIVSGFSEALAGNSNFASQLWEIIGYVSMFVGISFLVLDSFEVAD